MSNNLEKVLALEHDKKYNEAYHLYKELIIINGSDFEIWRHYFFFLWSMLEDFECIFNLTSDTLNEELKQVLKKGIEQYSAIAEFNFLAGYTISILPYEFGDYEYFEKLASEMLYKSTLLEPENLIYKMVYLANCSVSKDFTVEYLQSEIDAAPKVLETYKGKGLMNNYFKQVLYRINKLKSP